MSPEGLRTVTPEGSGVHVTGGINGKRRLRAAWVEDASPPPHEFNVDRPTRYRFICEHRNGTRTVPVTYVRLARLYEEAVILRRPEIIV